MNESTFGKIKPPTEAAFHPENELAGILKLPTQERKQALSRWKEEYAKQRTSLAILQADLVSFARENPEATIDQLLGIVDQENENSHFTEEQLTITRSAIELYNVKHEVVTSIREKFPEDRELFKAIFGIYPYGKIKIEAGLVTLNITCTNRLDFARVFDYNGDKSTVFLRLIKGILGGRVVGASFGELQYMPELNGTVIAEDSSAKRERGDGDIMIHEEQHAFMRLWSQIETAHELAENASDESTSEADETENNILQRCKENIRWRIADELLARLKSGEDGYRNAMAEIEASYLDAFLENERDILLESDTDSRATHVTAILDSKKFRNSIKDEVFSAVHAYNMIYGRLELSHEEITALLAFEPLSQWIKLAHRLVDQQAEDI